MSARTVALLAAAADATAVLKAATVHNREDEDRLFAESALATAEFLKARGSGAALAEANAERKSGYGSPAAVQYHGLAGTVLGLPDGGFDGTAKSVQTKVKAIYQVDADLARAIVKRSKTIQGAVDALADAKPATTLADHLAKARKALENAAELRVAGAEYDQAAQDEVAVILAALDLVVAPQTVTVSKQAEAVAA
jgi:hypothetical protein